jgi:DNA-binding transcriptional LysR family regulator
MKPDLNLLAVLDALCRTGSVSGAAEALSLSQPAVSHALNRLRAATGDPLFIRNGRGISPTSRALALAAPVGKLVAEAREFLGPAGFDPSCDTLSVRLGVSDYVSLTLLPALIARLRRQAPNVRVEAVPIGDRLLRQMAEGAVELSFWGSDPPPHPIRSLPLFDDGFVAVLAVGHPLLAGNGQLTLRSYLSSPHAVVSFGHPGRSPVDVALAAAGHSRRVVLASSSFAANLAAVAASDLVTTLPARLVPTLPPALVARSLPFSVPRFTYYLIWTDRTDQSLGLAWLRGQIAEIAGDAKQ